MNACCSLGEFLSNEAKPQSDLWDLSADKSEAEDWTWSEQLSVQFRQMAPVGLQITRAIVKMTVSFHGDLLCSHAWVNYTPAALECVHVALTSLCLQPGCPRRASARTAASFLCRWHQTGLAHTFLPAIFHTWVCLRCSQHSSAQASISFVSVFSYILTLV